jgi:hypothetical protein
MRREAAHDQKKARKFCLNPLSGSKGLANRWVVFVFQVPEVLDVVKVPLEEADNRIMNTDRPHDGVVVDTVKHNQIQQTRLAVGHHRVTEGQVVAVYQI